MTFSHNSLPRKEVVALEEAVGLGEDRLSAEVEVDLRLAEDFILNRFFASDARKYFDLLPLCPFMYCRQQARDERDVSHAMGYKRQGPYSMVMFFSNVQPKIRFQGKPDN